MPDVPLVLLTGWYVVRKRFEAGSEGTLFGPEYDALSFGDPVWIAGHNVMHAPLVILLGLVVSWKLGKRHFGGRWTSLYWFAIGCGIHSLLDIATHHHDGPLLLFPLDFSLRFASPVSYWDPRYHGRVLMLVEHAVDAAAAIAMLRGPATRWVRRLHSNVG